MAIIKQPVVGIKVIIKATEMVIGVMIMVIMEIIMGVQVSSIYLFS